jgi:hypothetical protein
MGSLMTKDHKFYANNLLSNKYGGLELNVHLMDLEVPCICNHECEAEGLFQVIDMYQHGVHEKGQCTFFMKAENEKKKICTEEFVTN